MRLIGLFKGCKMWIRVDNSLLSILSLCSVKFQMSSGIKLVQRKQRAKLVERGREGLKHNCVVVFFVWGLIVCLLSWFWEWLVQILKVVVLNIMSEKEGSIMEHKWWMGDKRGTKLINFGKRERTLWSDGDSSVERAYGSLLAILKQCPMSGTGDTLFLLLRYLASVCVLAVLLF